MISFRIVPCLILMLLLASCKNKASSLNGAEDAATRFSFRIPAGENSWVSNTSEEKIIHKEGIKGWTNKSTILNSYVRVNSPGQLNLGLVAKSTSGTSRLRIKLGEETREIEISNKDFQDVEVGTFELEQAGYQRIEIEALERTGEYFPEISEILLGGEATAKGVNFVEENFHFGRRGPSVHLRYELPEEKNLIYFYNEIEVPEGEDVIGSYFMANGFTHGYFGIQVNSNTERRILFSVWSPFETQNPEEIPEEYQIKLLDKGENVVTGKFGNEGSGGQSYKKFNWKAGTTYGFLLKGEPNGDETTDFTAYFFAPEVGKWQLIASFKRPHTDTHLKDLYSFLENFVPSTGDTSRKAFYKNQWVSDTQDQWTELTKAQFTADATARAGHRKDYAGGVTEKGFYLKDCGFFDKFTEMNTFFEREAREEKPEYLHLFLEREAKQNL